MQSLALFFPLLIHESDYLRDNNDNKNLILVCSNFSLVLESLGPSVLVLLHLVIYHLFTSFGPAELLLTFTLVVIDGTLVLHPVINYSHIETENVFYH